MKRVFCAIFAVILVMSVFGLASCKSHESSDFSVTDETAAIDYS